jgi:hypothetical protein
MSFLRKIGYTIQKIDSSISHDPEIPGKRFEDHIQQLFSINHFKLIEKNHSAPTNSRLDGDSTKDPDFLFEYLPTGEKFAVACVYRTQLPNQDHLEWSSPAQLQRYQEFEHQRKIPVFIIIGLELSSASAHNPDEIVQEKCMFNIPLKKAPYPALRRSEYANCEREYERPFFWKNGNLY